MRKILIHLIFIDLDMIKSHYVRPDTPLVIVWIHCHYCRPLIFYNNKKRLTRDELTEHVKVNWHYHVRLTPVLAPIERLSVVQDLEEADTDPNKIHLYKFN